MLDHNEARFRMIGHACVLATYQGKSLLFDPWFGRPVNYGTFAGYPNFVPPTESEKESIVGIHISHVHFDHFCPEDLKAFSKDIPILISHYQRPDFISSLKRAGLTNIIQVGSGEKRFEIGPFKLSCFTKSPEDGTFDSSCVVEIAEKNYYLNNDCQHNEIFYHTLSHCFGEFQGAFLGYAVANPLPWGTDFSECTEFKIPMQKDAFAVLLQKIKWEHVAKVSNILKPKWAVPYASSYRFKNADLAHLNRGFGFDEQIYDLNLNETTAVVLKHGETVLCEMGTRLNNAGDVVTEKSTASSPVVPAEHLLPQLFDNNLTDAALDGLASEASGLFFDLFSRQGKKWNFPMILEVQLFSDLGASSLYYHVRSESVQILRSSEAMSVDAVIRLPAGPFSFVLEKKMSLTNFHYLFCTQVKWKSWKYGQSNFLKWD